MSSFLQLQQDPDLEYLYPSSDGQPMADNTQQYRWIVLIKENLELILAAEVDVFVAADLLWYPVDIRALPVPESPKTPPVMAPDVMVAFGRPQGDRPSYRQWLEDNIAPQVVFEILSDSNKTAQGRQQMAEKFKFYQQYGVEEYYIYDPDEWRLQGWRRREQALVPIKDLSGWISPRLKIRFEWGPEQELALFRPDGQRFLNLLEVEQRAREAEQALSQERERAQEVEQALNQERERTQQMAALLRSMGIDPDQLPEERKS